MTSALTISRTDFEPLFRNTTRIVRNAFLVPSLSVLLRRHCAEHCGHELKICPLP